MTLSIKKVIASLGLAAIISSALAAVEFIDLYNRSPDEVSPILSNSFPHVPISSYGGQLVINGTAQQNQQIREMVAQLDTPARRLLITLDTGENSQTDLQGIQTRGSIQLGSHNSVRGQARIQQRSTLNSNNSLKQIMVNEGSPTAIQVGQSVPITYQVPDHRGRPVTTTQYQDVMQNLYVSAQVVGQQVFINLSSQNDRFSPRTGNINQQGMNTRVSGQLGQWITIGSLQDSSNQNSRGLGSYSQSSGVSNTLLRVKVDLAN